MKSNSVPAFEQAVKAAAGRKPVEVLRHVGRLLYARPALFYITLALHKEWEEFFFLPHFKCQEFSSVFSITR